MDSEWNAGLSGLSWWHRPLSRGQVESQIPQV
jgi:hypothetical protein